MQSITGNHAATWWQKLAADPPIILTLVPWAVQSCNFDIQYLQSGIQIKSKGL
jgi:hypothetical protein